MSYELTIAEGKGRGQRFQFDAPDVTIGRGAENDVVLNDAGVSRNHARIRQAVKGYELSDNGSANGTDLNGSIIGGPTLLRDGDRIGVGPIVFRFEAVRAELPAMPAGSGDETRITGTPKAPPRNEETRVSAMPAKGATAAPTRAVELKAGGALAEPQGLVAQFNALPKNTRIAAGGALALIFVAIIVSWARGQKPAGPVCPDVVAMSDDTVDTAFGRGPVDVDCGAKASFGFNAPAKTRVLFHYQANGVDSASELELKLNGKHLAWAPISGAKGEDQVLPLADELLASDGRNVVTFAESKDKEWSVDRVRVEILAVIPGNLKDGQAAYERGRRKFEERKVAPRNLYDAWKFFTAARASLEGLQPRPPLYGEVAQLIKDTEKELDKECSRLIFSANRLEKYGQDDKAQLTYREILQHFPGEDPTGCRKKGLDNLVSKPVDGQGQ